MDSEIENKAQGQSTESEGTREGGYNPAGGYQRNYHSNGRRQRPRINSQRAYSSDRGSSNSEGGFRPEGFGAGLQSSNGEHSQQRGGYQSRGGYGRPQGGGYGNNRGGGFRQHTPGYDPNAKYSMKKRIEYKEENIDPTEPLRLN